MIRESDVAPEDIAEGFQHFDPSEGSQEAVDAEYDLEAA